MIRLFIGNQEVELDESVEFSITKQFEDLSNPTNIKNDWSKTVSIPFTQKNNKLFGHIYNPDKIIVDNGNNNTGIYFDPYKKIDFRLQWNDSILMIGYVKMNEIKLTNGKGTYEITLFGLLGKLFLDMKKITFNTKTSETDYLIDGAAYVEEKINRTLVYNSWNSTGQSRAGLELKYTYLVNPETGAKRKVPNISYKVTDIIGFAPNNAFSEGFDYKMFQGSSTSATTFADYLGDSFTTATGIEPSNIIGNGLSPRGYGEFRSYFQLPFIYWNKLFQIFQQKAQLVTGYTFDLDSNWFNTSNPYWYNLVYMLKPLNFSNKDTNGDINTYITTNYSHTWTPTRRTSGSGRNLRVWYTWDGTTSTNVSSFTQKTETVPIYVSNNTFQISSNMLISNNGNFDGRISLVSEASTINPMFNPNQAFVINLIYTGVNTGNTINKTIVVGDTNTTSLYIIDLLNNADSVGVINSTGNYHDSTLNKYVYYFDFTAPLPNFDFTAAGLDTEFNISYTTTWAVNNSASNWTGSLKDFAPLVYSDGLNNRIDEPVTTDLVLNLNMIVKQGVFYSESSFTLNDLWNNEYNLFEEIIKYCKMYHILIDVDNINKKIVFKRSNIFFLDYIIVDWTNNVDKSKDFVIKPISFDNKYVIFNYKDSKTILGEEYKKSFGLNYGDYRLVTDYNFNSNTIELFKDITPSIVSTDNVLSWLALSQQHSITYVMGAEIFVNNKDKDNKLVDIFGAYFFYNGKANFDTGGYLSGAFITDDTDFQINNSTLFYHTIQSKRTFVTTYPNLDIINGNNMCIFNVPSVNYTYKPNYSGKNSIYKNIWENYINERYNIQNKILTCYINLKPQDWINFKFNNFILIDNQLYIVNKIYDYNIESVEPTKVDLITISDITGYTS